MNRRTKAKPDAAGTAFLRRHCLLATIRPQHSFGPLATPAVLTAPIASSKLTAESWPLKADR
ncbi:MAG: hypothetical protein DMF89_00385 [Acidobacteria bacterium]|nr:MAG: hypothetical protein DMF90_29155 [Acidobacteriota bacterium]PYR53156.1 MAG: hypothetical protein DMF89_00385 [Acidobacteriota bacterium]